ncbi:hypothetical protein Tco_1291803 [Tanacetum coccineum]
MELFVQKEVCDICHEKGWFSDFSGLEGVRETSGSGDVLKAVVKLKNSKVEFRIDLVHGATSVTKSPYRLAPLECKRLSEQLLENEHGVHLKLVLELLRKEKLYVKVASVRQ